MTKDDRAKVEDLVKKACAKLDTDTSGKYHQLSLLPKDISAKLESENIMLKEPLGPIPMVASGSSRDWPLNRGIHIADSGKF